MKYSDSLKIMVFSILSLSSLQTFCSELYDVTKESNEDKLSTALHDYKFDPNLTEINRLLKNESVNLNVPGKARGFVGDKLPEILPLEYSILLASPDVLKLLLSYGADPYVKSYGRNIFEIAKSYKDNVQNNLKDELRLSSKTPTAKFLKDRLANLTNILTILDNYKKENQPS